MRWARRSEHLWSTAAVPMALFLLVQYSGHSSSKKRPACNRLSWTLRPVPLLSLSFAVLLTQLTRRTAKDLGIAGSLGLYGGGLDTEPSEPGDSPRGRAAAYLGGSWPPRIAPRACNERLAEYCPRKCPVIVLVIPGSIL